MAEYTPKFGDTDEYVPSFDNTEPTGGLSTVGEAVRRGFSPPTPKAFQAVARGATKVQIPFTEEPLYSAVPKPAPDEQDSMETLNTMEGLGEFANIPMAAAGAGVGKLVEKAATLRKFIPGYGKAEQASKGFVMKNLSNGEKSIQNAGADFLTSSAHGKTDTDKMNSLVDFAKQNKLVISDPKEASIASEKVVDTIGEKIGTLMKNASDELETNAKAIAGTMRSRKPEDYGQFMTGPIIKDIMKDITNITSDKKVLKNVQSRLIDIGDEPSKSLVGLWEARKALDDKINYKSLKNAIKKGTPITETQQAMMAARAKLQTKISEIIESIKGTATSSELKKANLEYQKALGLDMMAAMRERSQYMPKLDLKVTKGLLLKAPEMAVKAITSPKLPSVAGTASSYGTRGLLPLTPSNIPQQ